MSEHGLLRRDRVCIFIDNTNLLHAVRTLAERGQRIDYFFLKEYLAHGRSVDARFYYSDMPMDNMYRQERHQKFLTSIEEFGYTIIGIDSVGRGDDGSAKEGGLEMEILYDMAVLSRERLYGSFILVANDDAYARVVKRIRMDTGMEIDVAFFGLPSCCTLLNRAASHYHDLSKISDRLFRSGRVPAVPAVALR
jgi:NYN domain